jgi:MFS family permease
MYTTIGYGLAAVVAGLLGGAVVEWLGLRWVFALATAAAAVAVGMAWRVAHTPETLAGEPRPV